MSTSNNSSYNHFKTIAISGVGGLGAFILDSLVVAQKSDPSLKIIVLSRTQKALPRMNGEEVKLVQVDYEDEIELERVLKEEGVQVVVSTIRIPDGIQAQKNLASASKKAGVELFVPSEFGGDTTNLEVGTPRYAKRQFHDFLKEIDLAYTLIFNGPFTDVTFISFLGFDFANKRVSIVGKGNTTISFNSRHDVSRFLVHAITHFPLSSLANKTLRIETDRLTLNQVVELYNKIHETEIVPTYQDTEQAKTYIEGHKDVTSFLKWLLLSWEEGDGDVSSGGALSNELWKGWEPKDTVQNALEKIV